MPDVDMDPSDSPVLEWGSPPEKVAFLTESYTVFTSLQKIATDAARQSQPGFTSIHPYAGSSQVAPTPQTMQYYHRISGLYRDALRRYMEQVESLQDADLDELLKFQSLHTILHLTEVLYFPSDGRGAGVVGEEILHWLNSFDVAPTTEEGQEIAEAPIPHAHPAYWDYILRCVLRGFHTSAASALKSLNTHQSSAVRRVADRAVSLLSTLPRSTGFGLEHEFLAAHRAWVSSVRSVLSGLEQEMDDMEAEAGGTDEVEDERLELEAQFRCLLELMAGVKDRIFEACEDWREALGAWGTLVQPTLKRDDIPETVNVIFEQFPIDGTVPSELVQSALVKGQVPKAIVAAEDCDLWLAAHLGDLASKAGLLEDDISDEPQNLREEMIIKYANGMLEDQGLWRITVDYLAACGDRGHRQLRKVILDVPLTDANAPRTQGKGSRVDEVEAQAKAKAMDEDGEPSTPESPDVEGFERVEEVLRACMEHGLEDEARIVCKRMSVAMCKEQRYGLAVAYCVRAGDGAQIRRISDTLLEEYIDQGAEKFVALVDSIPSSLLRPKQPGFSNGQDAVPTNEDEPFGDLGKGFFSTRLAFLARYRDFHRLYSEGRFRAAAQLLVELVTSEAAPETFWAVLLVDAIPLLEADQELLTLEETFELMRLVEQIQSSISTHQDLADHYLGHLERLLLPRTQNGKGRTKVTIKSDSTPKTSSPSSKVAAEKLDLVRLGLSRNLARVSVARLGRV
ncbi:Nucleoporin, Nup85-like protein [Violaceomyces palustris]|uniref:Nucleoporin, Nup85-like protein n=1 Tax=Violaceomyces palustris TaxID=1673888 RepID=A0ACD0P300_9BASI|nr:Nucleoporin, Nup85-like protein [Violaceomyces palustris]